MIRFNFDAERGEVHEFDGIAEAILWAQAEKDAWSEAYGRLISTSATSSITNVVASWESAVRELKGIKKRNGPTDADIGPEDELVMLRSDVGQALAWSYKELTASAFEAALSAAGVGGPEIDWSDHEKIAGVVAFDRAIRNMSEFSQRKSGGDVAGGLKKLEGIVKETEVRAMSAHDQLTSVGKTINEQSVLLNGKIAELQSLVATRSAALEQNLEGLNHKVQSGVSDVDRSLSLTRTTQGDKLDAWLAARQEQSRLEAPVALWEGRAVSHETALVGRKYWALGTGVAGLLLAGGIFGGALTLARALFAGAVVSGKAATVPAIAGSIRQTFHFELLFAGASTLLFLTMYLWTIRVLVRLYTTEHHLAIDVRGRSALVETYLSLTAQQAATDADRAIMLQVIFRPVQDGMVRDDGPPATTPAAAIANYLAGSGKTG